MTRPARRDAPERRSSVQGEITDQIEKLVPGDLVLSDPRGGRRFVEDEHCLAQRRLA
jgi:hypothetical protein